MTRSAMLRVAVTVALAVPISGCGGTKSAAEAAVRENLKDPDSARFGEFYFNKKTQKGCLTVNAKNSMGGYTGDQVAYLSRKDGKWSAFFMESGGQEYCRSNYADAAN